MTAGGADDTSAHLAALHPPAAHVPVMLGQVVDGLQVRSDGIYLDGTFGRGGHARALLERLGAHGRLLLMDKDPDAIAVADAAFGDDPRVAIRRGSFAELAQWDRAAAGLDGILFDLGVSSPQLDIAARGFSFGKDGPLDMRMDPDAGDSAAQWLAHASEQDIAEVLWTFGEERMGRRIARAIVAGRDAEPLTRTAQLAELIASVVPRGRSVNGKPAIHPATRSFQAIRIHVNRELADIEDGLDAALAALNVGGRLAVISFHSLEDRIAKRFIASHAKAPAGNRRLPVAPDFVPTLGVIGDALKADAAELRDNPRARSAVLRVAEKLGSSGLGTRDSGLDQARASSANDAKSAKDGKNERGFAPLSFAPFASFADCSDRVPSPESRVPSAAERRP